MATPKWQEPLVARADQAVACLDVVLRSPGGGAGALAAAAAADRELAELCLEVAGRSASPLLPQLLQHGARALRAQADTLQASVVDDVDDDAPVWADLSDDEDQDDDEPADGGPHVIRDARLHEVTLVDAANILDDGQALVVATPGPVVTSDDAPADTAADEPSSMSALAPGTRVEIVGGVLLGRAGVVADPAEVEEYAGEEPGARVWVETDGGDRVSPLVADLRVLEVEEPSLVERVREFGTRQRDEALARASAWTRWADELDRLGRRWPGRPQVRIMDDCGDVGKIELGVDYLDNLAMMTALQQLRSQGDALAAAYRRAAAAVEDATSETLQELWIRGGES